MKSIDITGMKFGRLTASSFHSNHFNKSGRSQEKWNFNCECGNKLVTFKHSVKSGATKSCGCLSPDVNKKLNTTHGLSKSREYTIWAGMKARCMNQKDKKYMYYGGRGISVCSEWLHFDKFISDMGPCPDGYSIERLDNDKGYSPDNCIWADYVSQNRNQSNSIYIEHDGFRRHLNEWSEMTGISSQAIKYRIKAGWNLDEVLSKPTQGSL